MADPHTIVSSSARPLQLNAEVLGGVQLNDQGGFHALAGGVSGSGVTYPVDRLDSDIANSSIISALNFVYASASGNEPGAPVSAIQFNGGSGAFAGSAKMIFDATNGMFLDVPLAVTGNIAAAGRIIQADTTEATSTSDGALSSAGGLSIAKSAVIGEDLDLLSNGAILKVGIAEPFTLTHSNADNTLLATSGDRLAFGAVDEYISGDGTDLDIVSSGNLDISATSVDIVGALTATKATTLASAEGVTTIGSSTSATVSAAGLVNVQNTTDALSKTDGSLQTDGGLSVTKGIFNGTDATLAADSGVVTMGSTTSAVVTAAGIMQVNNATDATTNADGSLQTDGGLSVKKAIYQSTAATFAAASGVVTMGSTTAAVIGATGIISVNNATEATSTADGSLQTDGGLSVAKSVVIGDDLDLLSDGAILNFGSSSKFTLTDQGAANTVMATSGHRLAFGDMGEYVSGDGTDLKIVSSADIDMTATTVAIGTHATVGATLGVTGVSNLQGAITGSSQLLMNGIATFAQSGRFTLLGGAGKALFVSGNFGPAGADLGTVLTVAQAGGIPALALQGTDNSGALREFRLQVSGGLLVATQY